MKRVKYIVGIIAIGLIVCGCSKRIEGEVTILDRNQLLEISKKAIAQRLPEVSLEDLELRNLMYLYSIDEHMNPCANNSFGVDFRVQGSEREEVVNGETVFKYDTIDVDIELDGQIGETGVRKGFNTYRSSSMTTRDKISSRGGPVSGEPFYPVKLAAPLPVPDKDNLKGIAFRAIRHFEPDLNTTDMKLCSVAFLEQHRPEDGIDHAGFFVEFLTNSSEGPEDSKSVCVLIDMNGHVYAKDVIVSPSQAALRMMAERTDKSRDQDSTFNTTIAK